MGSLKTPHLPTKNCSPLAERIGLASLGGKQSPRKAGPRSTPCSETWAATRAPSGVSSTNRLIMAPTCLCPIRSSPYPRAKQMAVFVHWPLAVICVPKLLFNKKCSTRNALWSETTGTLKTLRHVTACCFRFPLRPCSFSMQTLKS